MTLLSFVNPLNSSQTGQQVVPAHQETAQIAGRAVASADAVAPPSNTTFSGGSNSSTSYSGSGAGAGNQQYKKGGATLKAPSTATSKSVVFAQASATADAAKVNTDGTESAPNKSMPTIIDTAQKAREVAASLPDPLPTSPIIKELRAREG